MTGSRRDFLRRVALGGAAAASGVAACRRAGPGPDDAAIRKVEAILADPELWGKGFGDVLAGLPTWAAAGVGEVLVFPGQVVGGTGYQTEAAAAAARDKVAAAKPEKKYVLRPALLAIYRDADPDAPKLKPEVLAPFADDQTARVAWPGGGAKFLADGLTVRTVQRRLGKPEKVATVAISSERDSRPLALTRYVYAGGAVAFVESDAAVTPGRVDRVVLAVAPVVAAAFEEKP